MGDILKNFGPITAYGMARKAGYTGTKSEFAAGLVQSATAADTATRKAAEAVTAAGNAGQSELKAKESETRAGASETAAQASAEQAAASAAAALAVASIPPPACGDMGVVIGTASLMLTWRDPSDLVNEGWECAIWQRTVAVMKEGSYPSGVEDGVIVAATSRDPEHDTFELPEGVSFGYKDAYRTTSATVQVADGDTACVKLFSCATNGAWNSLAANEYPSHTVYSWGQLAEYADAGTFLQHVPMGSTLDMEHADFPGHQWEVMGMDGFVPKNPAQGHHVCLVSRYTLFSAPADAPESTWELTTDTAAVTGVTYGLLAGGSVTAMAEGTDWTAGDTSVTKDGVTYPIADWYERNPNPNQGNGSNYTPQRNDVQWMDTDKKGGEWFEKRNKWDACNATLAARHGFLRNLPEVFRENMVECTRTAYVYTSYRKRGVGASVKFDSRCFPLNLYEILGTVVGGVTEGKTRLAYFANGGTTIAYTKDGVASAWYSASAITNSASNVNYITNAGSSACSNASAAGGYRPACAYGKQVSLEATTPEA